MATWYIGGTRGMRDRPGDLTVGTASVGGSVDVEVRINQLDAQAKPITKLDVRRILELTQDYIEQNGIPSQVSPTTPGTDLPPL